MSREYKKNFDRNIFLQSITNLVNNSKFRLAKKELEKFLEENPYDLDATKKYIDILFFEGDLHEVEKLCEPLLFDNYIKYKYGLVHKRLGNQEFAKEIFLSLYEDFNDALYILNYVMILIKQGYFEEAQKYISTISEEQYDIHCDKILILKRYINKVFYPELIDIFSEDKNLSYYLRQINKYDEQISKKRFLKCKKDSHCNYIFSDDINLSELFDISKNLILYEEPYDYNLFDVYILKCPDVATFNGRVFDYVKVLTSINTKDVITIRPYDNYDVHIKDIPEVKIKRYALN